MPEIFIMNINFEALINHRNFIHEIMIKGSQKTGKPFNVFFYGDDCGLSHIRISTKGKQKKPNNRIPWVALACNTYADVYYSEENGIRISIK